MCIRLIKDPDTHEPGAVIIEFDPKLNFLTYLLCDTADEQIGFMFDQDKIIVALVGEDNFIPAVLELTKPTPLQKIDGKQIPRTHSKNTRMLYRFHNSQGKPGGIMIDVNKSGSAWEVIKKLHNKAEAENDSYIEDTGFDYLHGVHESILRTIRQIIFKENK